MLVFMIRNMIVVNTIRKSTTTMLTDKISCPNF